MRAVSAILILSLSTLCSAGQSVSNSESNTYSSGANITNQNVINNSDNMALGDVRCPKPTLGLIGGTSAVTGGNNPEQYHIGIGVTIPLLTEDCDEAVKLQLKILRWSALDREISLKQRSEQHEIKMANSCYQIPKGSRPKVCNKYRATHTFPLHK